MRKFTVFFSIMAVVAVLAVPAIASAGGYSSVAGVQSSGGPSTGTPTSAPTGTPTSAPTAVVQSENQSGGLPFTGLDIGLVLVGGVLLVGAGVALRRVSTSRM